MTGAPAPDRILVAGIGNVFLGDDGFGVEVVRRLADRALPGNVELLDSGVRGVHLAYRLLDGYRTAVLVDAAPRGEAPGTLYLIEPDEPGGLAPRDALIDGHHMSPAAVLALLGTLSGGTPDEGPRRVVVVGCEPACLEEGVGLSGPVAAAVDRAVGLVLRVLREESGHGAPPPPAAREPTATG